MSDGAWFLRKVSPLLVGDLRTSHLLEGGPLSPDEAARTIAAMPPLIDLSLSEIKGHPLTQGSGYRLRLPLRTADGPTGISLIVDTRPDGTRLIGFDGPAPAPIEALPTPRLDGRVPRAQWVGSMRLRWDRLMQGVPEGADRWDDVNCPSQALFLLDYADGDIYNGSLHQLYANSTGDFADRFPEWAGRIGAPVKADIVAETNLLFHGIDIRDRSARNDRLDELVELTDDHRTIRDPFDDPTGRYYASDEDLRELAISYVEHHPGDFFT